MPDLRMLGRRPYRSSCRTRDAVKPYVRPLVVRSDGVGRRPRERLDVPVGDRLHGSRGWRIFRQQGVGSRDVVIRRVSASVRREMRLVKDDDVIETLAPNGSDHAFDIRVLPRTRWRRDDFIDAHAGDSTSEEVAIDGISIPQEPEWGGVLGKRLDELLGRPGRGGMLR